MHRYLPPSPMAYIAGWKMARLAPIKASLQNRQFWDHTQGFRLERRVSSSVLSTNLVTLGPAINRGSCKIVQMLSLPPSSLLYFYRMTMFGWQWSFALNSCNITTPVLLLTDHSVSMLLVQTKWTQRSYWLTQNNSSLLLVHTKSCCPLIGQKMLGGFTSVINEQR